MTQFDDNADSDDITAKSLRIAVEGNNILEIDAIVAQYGTFVDFQHAGRFEDSHHDDYHNPDDMNFISL